MARIVLDLTPLRSWSGHVTGIQRVVASLATELPRTSNEVSYCSFDELLGEFREDQPLPYLDRIARGEPLERRLTRRGARSLPSTAFYMLPQRLRDRLGPSLENRLKAFVRRCGKSTRRAAVWGRRLMARERRSAGSGDILLVAGNLWDHPECLRYLSGSGSGHRAVVVVYDLIPVYQAHTTTPAHAALFREYALTVLQHAHLILAISAATARDVEAFAREHGIQPPRVRVVRLGDTLPATRAPARPPAQVCLTTSRRFALCVGTLEARKNHVALYLAYKLAAREGHQLPQMIIVGRSGWLADDVTYFLETDPEVREAFCLVRNATDSELEWLYANALFSVLPSQHEGWGLPIGEALAHGTPCVASDTSAMTEIAPDLVDHVSPFDTRALMEHMIRYSDPAVSDAQRAHIRRSYTPRSWAETAREIIRCVNAA